MKSERLEIRLTPRLREMITLSAGLSEKHESEWIREVLERAGRRTLKEHGLGVKDLESAP